VRASSLYTSRTAAASGSTVSTTSAPVAAALKESAGNGCSTTWWPAAASRLVNDCVPMTQTITSGVPAKSQISWGGVTMR
jgi:hypothetical protein